MLLESVYLSSRFERRDELNEYRSQLVAAGVAVTSRWLTDPMDPTPEVTDEAWRAVAAKDVEDVRNAAGLVLFAEPGRAGAGGRHVEFGVALGLGKHLFVIGGVENLFHRLPNVQVHSSWDNVFQAITQ